MSRPSIFFIGGTQRGFELLQMLIARGEKIVYACIMKEEPHESVQVSEKMNQLCVTHNIPCDIKKRINSNEAELIFELKPDVAFVCGWRTLIPTEFYKRIPFLAAHDSLLPKYRGFAPTAWAIINGEKETGVTLFKIDDGEADSGDIFYQERLPFGANETYEDIYPRIVKSSLNVYEVFLNAYSKGNITYQKQDERLATYTIKRVPQDGKIDWSRSAKEIYNLIRALTPPYPYAWTFVNGKIAYVKKASLPISHKAYSGNIPGKVMSSSIDGAIVLCGDGQIVLNEVILEGMSDLKAKHVLPAFTQLGS